MVFVLWGAGSPSLESAHVAARKRSPPCWLPPRPTAARWTPRPRAKSGRVRGGRGSGRGILGSGHRFFFYITNRHRAFPALLFFSPCFFFLSPLSLPLFCQVSPLFLTPPRFCQVDSYEGATDEASTSGGLVTPFLFLLTPPPFCQVDSEIFYKFIGVLSSLTCNPFRVII